jgi:ABC-2 type transport system permease protein
VFLYEYTHVLRKRFIFAAMSVPIIVSFWLLLVFYLIWRETNTTPIGYVDHSGLLAVPLPLPEPELPYRPIPMIPFETEEDARTALQGNQLQAYYVLSEDYSSSGMAKMVYLETPKEAAYALFNNFLAANLLARQPQEVSERLIDGSKISVYSLDKSRQFSSQTWTGFALPMAAGLALFFATLTCSGYLMQAIVEEKENRTMEIIITSVSPEQFMTGKIIADISIGLSQILIWLIFIILAAVLARPYVTGLDQISINGEMLVTILIIMIPAFLMFAALMGAIGCLTNASGPTAGWIVDHTDVVALLGDSFIYEQSEWPALSF